MWEDSTRAAYRSGGGTGAAVSGAQSGDLAGRVGEDGLLPELIIPGRGYGCSWYREHDVQRHRQLRQRQRTQPENTEIVDQEMLQPVTAQALDEYINDSIKGNV